jgi:hypothetical protein
MNKRLNRSPLFKALQQDRDSLLSLSPLNTVLLDAQKDLPARVARPLDDASDELAVKLIAGIRLQFKLTHPAHWLGSSLRLDFREMAEPDVR